MKLLWLGYGVAFVLSAVLTGWIRRFAMRTGLLDRPNARSSHTNPVPRGGGLSVVFVTSACVLMLWLAGIVDAALATVLIGGGVVIATVGYADDRTGVRAGTRLFIHLGASAFALYMLGGMPPIHFAGEVVDLGLTGDALGVAAVAWVLNLFNFMDGIDGIAASEAMFIAMAGGAIAMASGAPLAVPAVGMGLAAASLGFLIWNWPPAKLFMGDVGSGYLGYVIAVLALSAARNDPVALYTWLILGAVFFVDATLTLVKRLLKGERVHEAHCSHVYQILARRFRSHRAVTLIVLCVNLALLLPMAWLTTWYPAQAWLITLLVLVTLGTAAYLLDRLEERPSQGSKREILS